MISPSSAGHREVISPCVLRIILASISWSNGCWPPETEYRGRCVMLSRDMSEDSLQGGGDSWECWPLADAESITYMGKLRLFFLCTSARLSRKRTWSTSVKDNCIISDNLYGWIMLLVLGANPKLRFTKCSLASTKTILRTDALRQFCERLHDTSLHILWISTASRPLYI